MNARTRPHGPDVALLVVKGLHTAAWFITELCVGCLLYTALTRKRGPLVKHCGRGPGRIRLNVADLPLASSPVSSEALSVMMRPPGNGAQNQAGRLMSRHPIAPLVISRGTSTCDVTLEFAPPAALVGESSKLSGLAHSGQDVSQ